jgi:hypothetical protein
LGPLVSLPVPLLRSVGVSRHRVPPAATPLDAAQARESVPSSSPSLPGAYKTECPPRLHIPHHAELPPPYSPSRKVVGKLCSSAPFPPFRPPLRRAGPHHVTARAGSRHPTAGVPPHRLHRHLVLCSRQPILVSA